MDTHVVFRYALDGVRNWMKVTETKYVEIIEGKKFAEHGDIINQEQGGGGYHGNCKNCGLALVTDLGYCSWEGTTCEIKHEEITTISHKIGWSKHEKYASKLSKEDANKHCRDAIYTQGWGKYNFFVK